MKLKAVVYARYSSDKQTEQSIEGQLRECYDYADRNNYMIIHEYIDRALSGTTDHRPEFLQMIEDSKKKNFNYVIVYQLDRFARNRYDSATYKAKLTKNNVRVISARENIPDDASSVLVEGMLESMAEYYSKELSQKTKRGMKESILKGHWTGGFVTFGYDIVNSSYVTNESEAEIIQKIYKDFLNNIKMKDIVCELNSLGLKNKLGTSFTTDYISRILKNRKYIGEISQTYKSDIQTPQIIDGNTFELVQHKITSLRGKGGRNCANELYYLSGKIYCGYCNALVTADSGINSEGKTYRYYKCSKRKKDKNSCQKTAISKDYFENLVVDKTIQDIFNPKIIDEIALNVTNNFNSALKENAKCKSLEKQVGDVGKKIENIMNAIEQGIITTTTKEKLQEYENSKAELEHSLVIEREKDIKPLEIGNVKSFLNDFASRDYSNPTNRHRLLEMFVNRIDLYDNYAIIVYNGTNNPEAELNLSNKKTEQELAFEFGLLGSSGPARTGNLSVNSRVVHY